MEWNYAVARIFRIIGLNPENRRAIARCLWAARRNFHLSRFKRPTDFMWGRRLRFDYSPTYDKGRFAALYNKEVCYRFVQLSHAVSFAVADHGIVIAP